MIKLTPTGFTNVFQLEIYEWSNEKQGFVLTGSYEFCCHSNGEYHNKSLLAEQATNSGKGIEK